MSDRNHLTSRQKKLSPAKRQLLEKLKRGVVPSAHSSIPRRRAGEPTPLSFAQQRLWFLDRLDPGCPAYNVPSAVRLRGRLEVDVLRRSMAEIVRRHESLRTVFADTAEDAEQRPLTLDDLPMSSVDLCRLTAPENEAHRRLAREARRPFDLRTGPLLRLLLLRLAEDDYLFLVTMHHIVCDGASMDVLIQELALLYRASAEGEPPRLPELDVQYGDFALWQRRGGGKALDASAAWWRERLAGAPPLLELPADRPRPSAPSWRGASWPFELESQTLSVLKEVSQQAGATLFMTLLAVYLALVFRHTGRSDLVVGTPVANRNRPELEKLIGFFVNVLALRVEVARDDDLPALVARVRKVATDTYKHQDMPFEHLVEELRLPRNLSYHPVVQVMFALQSSSVESLRLPGLEITPQRILSSTSLFDLRLDLVERSAGLQGTFYYNADLWDAASVGRLAGHFKQLARGVTAEPSARLGTLQLLSPAELLQLCGEWNDTAVAGDVDGAQLQLAPLQRLFEAHVRRAPRARAVVAEDGELSFDDLNRKANRLAHTLRRLDVMPEEPVGLCVGRSVDLPVAVLGILKAGGSYLPLDPTYPAERLAFMVTDAGIRCIVAQAELATLLPAVEHFVTVEDFGEARDDDPAPVTSAAHLAYVLYTSGSTGRPKGVACTHAGVENFLRDMERRAPLTSGVAGSLWTSVSFDVAVYEIFSALCFGRALHLPPEDVRSDAPRFLRWLMEHRIATAYLPPFLLPDLEAALQCGTEFDLRRLLVGVEPIPEKLLQSLYVAAPELTIVNGYGPTEATVCATFYGVSTHPARDRRTPIGRAYGGVRIRLLDARLEPVPIGVPGEVLIGGAGLARGYHGRPALTAERFVPDPRAGRDGSPPGDRLYRTGDLARYLGEGQLEFQGRLDQQVKVRGFRIELEEIETVLALDDRLREVLVLADDGSPPRLLAFVVARSGTTPTPEELRTFLRDRLPEYMLPSAFFLCEAFPLTPNGKPDRAALLRLATTSTAAAKETGAAKAKVRPRGPTEELMAQLWAEILDVPDVAMDDNFFELGGHSLLATRLVKRVEETYGVALPVRILFEEPSPAHLLRCVEEIGRGDVDEPPLRAGLAPEGEPVPLSFAQERLWFIDRLEPGNAAYNVYGAVEMRGELRLSHLDQALAEGVQRHDVLRARFPAVDGKPEQQIRPGRPAVPQTQDVPRGPLKAAEHPAARLSQEELEDFLRQLTPPY